MNTPQLVSIQPSGFVQEQTFARSVKISSHYHSAVPLSSVLSLPFHSRLRAGKAQITWLSDFFAVWSIACAGTTCFLLIS